MSTSSLENESSLPSPPFYPITFLPNLRDAACSLHSTSGTPLRTGVLFRSADPSRLDAAGWQALKDLGVGTVFDLRSTPEIDRTWSALDGEGVRAFDSQGDKNLEGDEEDVNKKDEGKKKEEKSAKDIWEENMRSVGVERKWIPVFAEKDYSPERLAERYVQYMSESTDGFVGAYKDLLENAGQAFRQILVHLASLHFIAEGQKGQQRNGVLIHCTAGKDRTGLFLALLFSFLNVPHTQIADEYHLTERGLAPLREEIVARLMQSTGFKNYMAAQDGGEGRGGGEEKGRAAALRMISARKESMLATLEMVDREYGGAENYFRTECGVDESVLASVRENLLIGGADGS